MHISRMTGWFVAVGFIVGAVAPAAQGTTMTIAFEGIVDQVRDPGYVAYPEMIDYGDTLTGTCTIDLDTPDVVPEYDIVGEYPGAVVAMEGQVGDLTFSYLEGGKVLIENQYPYHPGDGSPSDMFGVAGTVLTEAGLAGLFEQSFDFFGRDISASVFDSDGLPACLPPLAAFEQHPLSRARFDFTGGFGAIRGMMTSWVTVPEPGSLAVYAAGAFFYLRRRRALVR